MRYQKTYLCLAPNSNLDKPTCMVARTGEHWALQSARKEQFAWTI